MIELLYFLLFCANTFLQSQYIFGGDSAEFVTTALTWSIPHPPGYPLYSLLVNLIRFVPVGTVPWRVALISSASASVTAYFLYKLLKMMRVDGIIAFMSSVLFLVLFPVWQYSLIPEVFLLNAALVSATTYFVFQYVHTGRMRHFLFVCFLIGLSIAHHHVFVLFVPGWLFVIRGRLKLGWHTVLMGLAAVLLGASFYLYAPIASLSNPPIDWENAKTLQGFFRLFLRSTYGTFSAYSGSAAQSSLVSHSFDFLAALLFIVQDFKIPGILVLMIWPFLRDRKTVTLKGFLIVTVITHILFLTYTNFVLTYSFTAAMYERFLISLYYALCICIAVAVHTISGRGGTLFRVSSYVFLNIYVILVAATSYRTIRHIHTIDAFDRIAYDIVATVPKNGILYASTDNTNFPVLYRLYGLHDRRDITFLHMTLLNRSHYVHALARFGRLKGVPDKQKLTAKDFEALFIKNEDRGIYMEAPLPIGYWMPYGLLWKYYSTQKKAVDDIPRLLAENKRLWGHLYHIPRPSPEEKNVLHLQVVQDFYREAFIDYSKFLFLAKEYAASYRIMKEAHRLAPSNLIEEVSLLNIASYGGLCEEAAKQYATVRIHKTELKRKQVSYMPALRLYEQKCKKT